MSRMADQIGRVLSGRYRLVAPIGSGASAQVYLADDVRLRRRVAVKLLHPALADDEAFLRRFRAEARAAAALSHPHVVAVYDWGDGDGTPYIVTEYLAGGSLRAMLDQGHRLSPSQALLVGLQAARALDVAHRRGLVHRDIKPANLLFGQDARLRVADFGLARAVAEAAWTEPQGAVLGTARYASPEQAKGEPVDGRADVYSLTLVLVEAVTGKVPFAADTTVSTLMARVGRAVEVPESLGPLRRPLTAAGCPDPAQRPDAGELVVGLMAAAEELPRPAPLPLAGAIAIPPHESAAEGDTDGAVLAPASRGGEAGAPPDWDGAQAGQPGAPAPLGAGAPERAAQPRRRRRRWLVRVALVVAAAAVGGTAMWAVSRLATPSYAVPRILGMQESEARQAVDGFGWRIAVRHTRQDDTVPGQVLRSSPPPGEELVQGGTLELWVSLGNELYPVPQNLLGLATADAVAAIEAAGFVPALSEEHHEEVPAGQVIAVQPDLPPQLPRDSQIALTGSLGPAPRTVPERLAGLTVAEARAALAEVQLGASVREEFSDDVERGRVIRSVPAAGAQAPRGSEVELVVSRGPHLVVVPDVAGRSLEQAVAAIEAAGLSVGEAFGPANGRPFSTDPAAGSKVRRGASVDVYLRRGA